MYRNATLFTLFALALAGCKNAPEARYDETPGQEQAYSTVPTQDALQTAADEDAARREQEEADAAAAAAAKEPPPPPPLGDADKTFIDTAAKASLAEVELSKAALEKAKKATVKEFAQKMIDDHTAANSELAALVTTRGVTLPTEPDEETKKRRTDLEKKSGSKFEKAYVDAMVADHKKAVELFRSQSTSGADPELKQWATTTLPKLEGHLAHAEALAKGKPYKPTDAAQASTDAAAPAPAGTGTTPPPGSAPASGTATSPK